jgi:hypothetical protein
MKLMAAYINVVSTLIGEMTALTYQLNVVSCAQHMALTC